MTKEMLLNLNQKLREGNITMSEILQLKEFTDEEIIIILNSNNPNEIKSLMRSEQFKLYPENIKKTLIDIIDKKYKGKKRFAINCLAVDVATNKVAISSGQIIKLTEIVRNSKEISSSRVAARIACNYYAIISGKVLELTTIASQFKPKSNEEEYLNLIYCAATDSHIIRSGKVVEIITAMIEVANVDEAGKIYYQEIKKHIKLINALKEENITEIDFWESFYEDNEGTINLLEDLPFSEELGEKTTILRESKTKQIRIKTKNKIHHLN